MRVLVISHTYITPANRGKLRALAARGLDVTVGVPQRWREEGVLGRTLEVAWERQNGVEVFPVPVRHPGSPDVLRFGGRALLSLLRDKRPDLIQVAPPCSLHIRTWRCPCRRSPAGASGARCGGSRA
ncbi:MAG: hypothetical protein AUH07_06415 [Gemmatimonadetes bacterium 13_2_20CM_70_9]|nr:MAG: hypothetical protein AUH07_06415 [Gemmatimonadetes bacterium 13_2_20CM_70_9]